MKLDGQVAVITGAGRGIGRAIALAYAREGARLALAARSEPELDETVAAVSELGAEAIAVRTDVTSQIGTERLARRTVERFGRIDVLVNNAGISGPVGPLQDNDIAEWVDTINVNLTGTFLVCRAVVPVMIGQGGGKIINLSGAGVANAWSNMSAYCSSKAAVVRLTEVLAQELEGKGITVNALGPGSVHTSMWEKMTEQAADAGAEFIHELGQRVLSGGGASIDDCAELAVWLASEESGNLTGRIISATADDFRSMSPLIPEIMEGDGYTLRVMKPGYALAQPESGNEANQGIVRDGSPSPHAEFQTASELLRQARIAYYDKADDKACARFLWEATFSSFRQLATQMGHPCEDRAQAERFAWFLEYEHGGKVGYAQAKLAFGLTMLDQAEGRGLSQDPEFAWTLEEFPLAIREVTRIAQSLSTFAKTVQS